MLSTINSYIPLLIRKRVAKSPEPLSAPEYQTFEGAVLYADISGFTRFTDDLVKEGGRGVERISAALNDYFGKWIEIINQHGGDLVKFGGDAVIVVWSAEDFNDGMRGAALQAVTCAAEAHNTLRGYQTAEGNPLFIRSGIASGTIEVVYLGGMLKRWEMLLAGDAISQVSVAIQQAAPGAISLTPQTLKLLSNDIQVEPSALGHYTFIKLNTIPTHKTVSDTYMFEVPQSALPVLETYIPGAIKERLAAGQAGWLAELRNVSVLFINLPLYNYKKDLAKVQDSVFQIQNTLYYYEGSINKIIVDEKGTTLVAAFGLPPFSHENDALRATFAALDIQRKLESYSTQLNIGLATGQVFCGSIGNATRREYTLIGQTVNLSARLMQAVPKTIPSGNRILADRYTLENARHRIKFETLAPVQIKGRSEPFPVFRPEAELRQVAQPSAEMIGRRAEQGKINKVIQAIKESTSDIGNIFVIEGEPGIGKSRLIESVLAQAQVVGVPVLLGVADAIEKATPFYAWRQIFAQIFEVDFSETIQVRMEKISAVLDSELMERASVLNDIMQVTFAKTEVTENIEGRLLADNTREVLVAILQKNIKQNPKVIVIEDAHWLDTASWALLVSIARYTALAPFVLVMTTRALSDINLIEPQQILRLPTTAHFLLERLSPLDTLQLVSRRLGVDELPREVNDLIIQKAEGHPFFSEELAYALRDSGVLIIEEGKCRLASGIENLESLNLPKTVQGVISSRIDRLPAAQQLTLKVASVIGRIFEFSTLSAIYPTDGERALLRTELNNLEALDITPVEAPDPHLTYIFKHSITRDVAYNLMLFSQRRQLHNAIADWYERTHVSDLDSYYGLLAYHYALAEEASKAVVYLEKAGIQALTGGAYFEAANYFEEALRIANQSRRDFQVSKYQRAVWEHQLGEAYIGLGMLEKSGKHFENAANLLGHSSPKQSGALIMTLLAQILTQAWRLQRNVLSFNDKDPEPILAAARAHDRLVEIYYFAQDRLHLLNSGIYALNLAQRAPLSPELARAYITLATVCSVIPLHNLAKRYQKLAHDAIEKINHLPSLARISGRSGLYQIGIADFVSARELLERAVDISEKLRDYRQNGESSSLLGWMAYLQADFEDNVQRFQSVFLSAKQVSNIQYQNWGCWGKSHGLLRLNRFAEAREALGLVIQRLENNQDSGAKVITYGLLSIICMHEENWEFMFKYLRDLVGSYDKTARFSLADYEGFASVSEVALTLWERETKQAFLAKLNSSLDEVKLFARRGLKSMNRYARVYDIGKPRTALLNGWIAVLEGKNKNAFKHWEAGLQAAKQMSLPYEQARLHQIICRHLPADSALAKEHRDAAHKIFTEIKAALDLKNF